GDPDAVRRLRGAGAPPCGRPVVWLTARWATSALGRAGPRCAPYTAEPLRQALATLAIPKGILGKVPEPPPAPAPGELPARLRRRPERARGGAAAHGAERPRERRVLPCGGRGGVPARAAGLRSARPV